jgi:hypothetical protein
LDLIILGKVRAASSNQHKGLTQLQVFEGFLFQTT